VAGEPLEVTAVRLLTERGLRIAVAESCTGGLIGHLLTNVPGSSRVFIGGVAAYHASAKSALLGVPEATLRDHGSVSAETALAMAAGIRERLDADLAVGVTGITGPGGGSEAKPVGLVYLALAGRGGSVAAREYRWHGDRESNKRQSANAALALVIEYLEQLA
jgi:PncC family amidohydrolase